ncbi:hypothetical protein NDA01_21720 [Trichocoleus desertorum AS-A10]|uniref:hypothetical protein n=1 Tax=Trichocoleus desertorum TaxID=1481672 RepID=UPI003298C18B
MPLPISAWQIVGIALLAIAFFAARVSNKPVLWGTAFVLLGLHFAYWVHKLWEIFMSLAYPG